MRVRATVSDPRGGWGSITHESVGIVTDMEFPRVTMSEWCTIDFPQQSGWRGHVGEMEVVVGGGVGGAGGAGAGGAGRAGGGPKRADESWGQYYSRVGASGGSSIAVSVATDPSLMMTSTQQEDWTMVSHGCSIHCHVSRPSAAHPAQTDTCAS